MHPDGTNSNGRYPGDRSAPNAASFRSSAFFLGAVVFGLAAVIVFQIGDGGFTVSLLLLKLFIYVSFILVCFALGTFGFLAKRSPLKVTQFDTSRRSATHLLDLFNKIMGQFSAPLSESVQTRRTVVSHNVDKALKEVFEYSYRDYVLPWYAPLSHDDSHLYHLLQEDFWEAVRQIRSRAAEVDVVRLVCSDVIKAVHCHFCDLKAANAGQEESPRPFPLHPSLRSPQDELRFLRCCARLLLLCLMPACYTQASVLHVALADILATRVLKPLVELLSDPDYINGMLLAQLEQREELGERNRKTYSYAPSYEDFIKLIGDSSDVDFLRQLRYQIAMEIMQATTISNLPQMKKQKGDGKGKELAAMKTDLLRARNMKRYINQLTVAKRCCEKRICLLAGVDLDEDDIAEEVDGPKVLQFEEIMSNPMLRQYFRLYMERMERGALIGFWELVETLKTANKSDVPQLVGEIYQRYFVDNREIPVDKALYKEVQQSLVGNRGTNVFHKIQADVFEAMNERFYPPFLVSDLYESLAQHQEQSGVQHSSTEDKEEPFEVFENQEDLLDEGNHGIDVQVSYIAKKLQQLQDKLEYKKQALISVQNLPKPDKKIVSKLKDEIGVMEKERVELQQHISRTEWWCENLGRWRAAVGSGEAVEESGEQVPYYCVNVSLVEGGEANGSHWVVSRKLSDFQALHRKLVECFPSFKKVQLPSLSKLPFKSIDLKFLEKSKNQLNAFLEKMLTDEQLCQSEALYAFLSPSPEHLKVSDMQKKSCFFLASFLERLPGDLFSHHAEDADDDSDFTDGGDETEGRKDAAAEPCFMLIGEIFELRGMFKWVRKTLIALVQVTFGRTINKQIRDTVSWMFSEHMLTYHINVLRDAFWPYGKIAAPKETRSDLECQETKERARQKLLDNIPDALQNLVGQQNARHGIIKIFNALQEADTNKHLLYVLLEIFLRELCPELGMQVEQV